MEKISFNFVPIPVSILKQSFKMHMSASETKIFLMILYQTYTFNDKPRGEFRKMSLSYMAKLCDIKPANLCQYLQRLEDRNIIITKKQDRCNYCKVNPKTEQWKSVESTGVRINFPKKYRKELSNFKKCVKEFAIENRKVPSMEDLERAIENYFEEEWKTLDCFEKIDFKNLISEIKMELIA